MSEKIKAVGYCRFSSALQREESIDAQKRVITNYASLYDYEITDWYCDEGKSGKTMDRPEFQRMMKDAEEGKIKAIIVHKLDRFSRSTKDTLYCISLLQEYGVAFISVNEKIDGTATGKMLVTVMSAANEYQINNLADEVMKGLKENAYKCMWTGGPAPLGYDVIKKQLVINEQEAKIIRLIFRLSAEGYGYGKIVDRLNLLGYKTKNGNSFGKNSIYDLIRNERYKGVFVFNKRSGASSIDHKRNSHKYKPDEEVIRIKGGCPAIVSEELWNTANSVCKVTGKYKTNAKRPYLLSGFLVCGECSAKLHGSLRTSSKGFKYMTYRCGNGTNRHTCKSREIKTEIIDNFVLNEIFKRFFTHDRLVVLAEKMNAYKAEKVLTDAEYIKANDTLNKNIAIRDTLVSALAETNNNQAIINRINETEENIKKFQNFIIDFEIGCHTIVTVEQLEASLEPLKERMLNAECIEQTKLILSHFIDKIVVGNNQVALYLKVDIPSTNTVKELYDSASNTEFEFCISNEREKIESQFKQLEMAHSNLKIFEKYAS